MRKIYLFCFFICCFFKLEAQSWIYHEFPDSNALWNVSYQEVGMGYCGEYTYHFGNDTLINSLSYHKILKTGHDFSMTFVNDFAPHWDCNHSIMYPNYTQNMGSLREDIAQRKVFIMIPGDSVESLLYDFNLQNGDTIKGYLSYGYMSVSSVDSINIDGSYRKRWHVNSNYPNVYEIIEGIGSSRGLLNPYNDFEYYSNLDCFSQDGTSLYPAASGNCNLLTSIKNEKIPAEPFIIYPNPSNGVFQVRTSAGSVLKICNMFGEEIFSRSVNAFPYQIDLSGYPDGVYFVTSQSPKKSLKTERIIKISKD